MRQGRALMVVAVLTAVLVVGLGVTWAVRGLRALELKQERRRSTREAASNLKAVFTAEKAYFAERDGYSEDFRAIGFEPERGNRFVYVVSRAGPMEDRSGAALVTTGAVGVIGADEYRLPGVSTSALLERLPATLAGGVDVGVSGKCPGCEVVAMCVGNLRDGVDTWSIATFARVLPDAGVIPAGVPNLE